MFGQTFYHELLRKYVVLFGNLFNSIYIKRYDSAGTLTTSIQVPLNYGPRDKALSRLDQNPNLIPEYAVILPRMSFEMTSMNYSPQRKLNTVGRRTAATANDPSKKNYMYNPVPYDINMALSIMVKNADDGAQILEQILPYFTPEFTVSIKPIAEMDFVTDIPIVLQGVTTEDTYEGGFENRRALIHTLDFVIKGHFYGPVKSSEIIKRAQVDLSTIKPINIGTIPPTLSEEITDAEIGKSGRDSRVTVYPVMPLGGNTASATTNITPGQGLSSLTLTNIGANYNTAPTVTISGGGGSGATATANLHSSNGSINALTLTSNGSGYILGPTVTIAAPTQSSTLVKFGNDAREHTSNTTVSTLNALPTDIDTGGSLGYRLSFWIYPRSADSDWKVIFHTPTLKIFYNGTTGLINFAFTNTIQALAGQGLTFDAWNFVTIEHIATTARIQTNSFLSSVGVVGSGLNTFDQGEQIKVGYAQASDSVADYASDSFTGAIDQVTFTYPVTSFTQTGVPIPTTAEAGNNFTQTFDSVQATADAVMASGELGGRVANVTIVSGGSGYRGQVPNTFFTNSPTGNTALGTAVLSANGDTVLSITLTSNGSGYLEAPSVTFSNPDQGLRTEDIDAADNFGFGVTKNFYQDNKKYNPVNDEDEDIG